MGFSMKILETFLGGNQCRGTDRMLLGAWLTTDNDQEQLFGESSKMNIWGLLFLPCFDTPHHAS
jgi:hypothetical protein